MADATASMGAFYDYTGTLAAEVTLIFDDVTMLISDIEWTVNSGTLKAVLTNTVTNKVTNLTKTSSGSQPVPQSFNYNWFSIVDTPKGLRAVPNGSFEYSLTWHI